MVGEFDGITVCVDLDGVLAEYNGWRGDDHFGEVIAEGRILCETLIENGAEVIIHTCRLNGQWDQTDYVEAFNFVWWWLTDNNIPFTRIATQEDGKPFAHAYIDDRAIGWNRNSKAIDVFLAIKRMKDGNN